MVLMDLIKRGIQKLLKVFEQKNVRMKSILGRSVSFLCLVLHTTIRLYLWGYVSSLVLLFRAQNFINHCVNLKLDNSSKVQMFSFLALCYLASASCRLSYSMAKPLWCYMPFFFHSGPQVASFVYLSMRFLPLSCGIYTL